MSYSYNPPFYHTGWLYSTKIC